MGWPPSKAWTSAKRIMGFRHFVAINYGGEGKKRWVSLVSVLDGKSHFNVTWTQLNDPSKWTSGWLKLTREESLPSQSQDEEKLEDFIFPNSCLHPSKDSGLLIPSEKDELRPWFSEDGF